MLAVRDGVATVVTFIKLADCRNDAAPQAVC